MKGTLATLLSGVQVTPFSFAEYCSYRQQGGISRQRPWSEYLYEGEFPAINAIDDDRARHDHLIGILDTVLLKDVAQRLNISTRNPPVAPA